MVDIFWLVNLNSYLFEVWLLGNVLNSVVLDFLDFIPIFSDGWLNNNGIVVEWVGIIEVFVRYDWLSSPDWLNNWSWLDYDEIVVWIVVIEVSIAQVSSGS